MVGSGAVVFAVMGYVVAHQDYDRASGNWVVRLNPTLLGAVLGEKPDDVAGAIEFLCKPDVRSTSKLEGGRRLVPVAPGAMEYRVVNGQEYQDRRDYEERKEQNRLAKQRQREREKEESNPPIEPPPGFPKTDLEAMAGAMSVGCPNEFAVKVWNNAMGRGGRDAKDVPIASWPHHLAAAWAYERERKNNNSPRPDGRKLGMDGKPLRSSPVV